MTLERLRTTLTALSLSAIDARRETLLESASKKEPAYADFLLEVMSAEADARRQRYLKTRLQLAHLPYVKTFDQFDFAFQPSIDERQIRELRTLRFLHEASNIILLGPPGVGKTHLAVALAEAAIQSGQAACFMTAHDLVTDLGRAYFWRDADSLSKAFAEVAAAVTRNTRKLFHRDGPVRPPESLPRPCDLCGHVGRFQA